MEKKRWLISVGKLHCFLVIFFIICLMEFVSKIVPSILQYDAADYWARGKAIGEQLALTAIDGFRGYIFPLYLGVCGKMANETMIVWRICNGIMVSLIFAVFIPFVQDNAKGNNEYLVKSVGTFILFSIFFYGTEIYPLSDLTALFFCLVAVCAQMKIFRTEKWKCFLWCFFLGGSIYCAYNVRTIYIFSGAWLIVWTLFQIYKRKIEIFRIVRIISGIVSGILIFGLPQAYMNYKEFGIMSIAVPTNGLMTNQLLWGMQYQRYGTYIGTEPTAAQMYFVDSVGQNLLLAESIDEILSIKEYIHIWCKYPFEMVGIYARHAINMLFPVWPATYVNNLNNCKVFLSILSFTIIFLFVIAILFNLLKNNNILCFIPLLIPVICITAGAVENRFFIALYIYIFSTIVFQMDWTKLLVFLKKYWIKLIVCYIGIYAVFLSVWTNMLASLWTDYPVFFE